MRLAQVAQVAQARWEKALKMDKGNQPVEIVKECLEDHHVAGLMGTSGPSGFVAHLLQVLLLPLHLGSQKLGNSWRIPRMCLWIRVADQSNQSNVHSDASIWFNECPMDHQLNQFNSWNLLTATVLQRR